MLLESVAIFLICIYGGYFGAAAGVLLLALLLRVGHATLAHANASKNVIAGVANTVAALIFVVSRAGALARRRRARPRLPGRVAGWDPWWCATPRRVRCGCLIGAAGLALAVKLGIDAYG